MTRNAPNQEPVYRKVAIVENFFDIIYTVHVELEGRPGKHAGQKRTYRTITETYAFLPREAVTRFLTGCAECARRPRSTSPPPLPTPSPSPTRHPYLPYHPAPEFRNWESEIDATNYYEPKFDYTELQPIKKIESPKPADAEDQPTYIELTSKKTFDPISRTSSPVEPAFREEQPVRTDPEIDKDDNSLIDVEDVKPDSPLPVVIQKEEEESISKEESTRVTESDSSEKTERKKYNPLDVANLTSKDPPKTPPRRRLLSSLESSTSRLKSWKPEGYYGEDAEYSVPITTTYLKYMRVSYQERLEMEKKRPRYKKTSYATTDTSIDDSLDITPNEKNRDETYVPSADDYNANSSLSFTDTSNITSYLNEIHSTTQVDEKTCMLSDHTSNTNHMKDTTHYTEKIPTPGIHPDLQSTIITPFTIQNTETVTGGIDYSESPQYTLLSDSLFTPSSPMDVANSITVEENYGDEFTTSTLNQQMISDSFQMSTNVLVNDSDNSFIENLNTSYMMQSTVTQVHGNVYIPPSESEDSNDVTNNDTITAQPLSTSTYEQTTIPVEPRAPFYLQMQSVSLPTNSDVPNSPGGTISEYDDSDRDATFNPTSMESSSDTSHSSDKEEMYETTLNGGAENKIQPQCHGLEELQDNLTPEPSDMNDDDNFTSQGYAKDAEKLKMMLLAWNYHNSQGRNGDLSETGGDSMADLWASYHSALGLGSKPPKAPTPMATGHSSPIHVGSVTPGVEPASTHDETSSSDRTKDDDDGGASDDDSDDRVDPHHHDPERLKAFNMFVRLFVDENLDRIVPISKQPKEKIQAIIDSCTRQFPEFAERARKRIRTYLKSCRRNKKVRGEIPTTGNGASGGNAWDSAVRPTPAHLTSVQAEHILAQACENESLNAKRMRLGLDPVSQPMPTVPTPMVIDTTATSAVASSFLSLYSGAISSPPTPATTTTSLSSAGHSKAAADTTRPSASPTMEHALLNNNSLKLDNANGSAGSKTASPASSPAPLFRPTFPNTFGNPPSFGRQNSNPNPANAMSSNALLSTLTALPPTGVGVNAAMAAYQSALLSAMAAHTHTFPTSSLSAPTDLSLKTTSTPNPIHSTSTASSLSGATSTQSKNLLSHKLSGAEVGAVRQLITGYRESAAFLLRSADELEALLMNQP